MQSHSQTSQLHHNHNHHHYHSPRQSQSELEYAQHVQSQLAHFREVLVRAKYRRTERESEAEGDAVVDMMEDAQEKIHLYEHLLEPLRHSLLLDVECVYAPHVIGVLSRWPCYDLLKDWLCKILLLTKGSGLDEGEELVPVLPLERYLVHFIEEMPLIPPGKLELCIHLGGSNFYISRPPANSISVMKNVGAWGGCRVVSVFRRQ